MLPAVLTRLEDAGLVGWRQLAPLLERRYADNAHGDMAGWRRAVEDLPPVPPGGANLDADTIRLLADPLPDAELELVRRSLIALSPWRKGPFDIGGVHIDSEWRSDWKWNRVRAALAPLDDRLVLDVGCGNGYYALRMLGAGARTVVGIDPTLLYCMQFRALLHFLPDLPVHVLPLRLAEMPGPGHAFDTTFSMGVLYHQRSPLGHLKQLRDTLKPGGELVLETLILPGNEHHCRTPPDRYARMRNVWLLPTLPELEVWLTRTGFGEVRVADVTATTTDEQRTTEWMPFESLAAALIPGDPARTVEGWPAPRRAVVICRSP